MFPSLIEIGSKTAEKNSVHTNRQTDTHYENNGHLAVNQDYQKCVCVVLCTIVVHNDTHTLTRANICKAECWFSFQQSVIGAAHPEGKVR